MAQPRQIAFGFVIAMLLIGSGLILGLSLQRDPVPPATALPSAETAPVAHNSKIYQISPPHQGQAYRSASISIHDVSGNRAVIYMPDDTAKKIGEGQPVLLYGKNGARLDIIGHVNNIMRGKDSFAEITSFLLTINDTPAIPAKTAQSGEIILEKFSRANRLPLSALVQPKDSAPYLWEAVKQADGTMLAVKRTPEKIDILNDRFFIFENNDYVSNLYLLSPDDAVRDGQIITVEKTLYRAPDLGDDQTIAQRREQAINDYRNEVKDTPLQDKTGNSAGSCASSCGPGAAAVDDFIAKVKALAQPKASQPEQP